MDSFHPFICRHVKTPWTLHAQDTFRTAARSESARLATDFPAAQFHPLLHSPKSHTPCRLGATLPSARKRRTHLVVSSGFPPSGPAALSWVAPLVVQASNMVAKDFTVDLDKPLVFQVGHLGETYQEWVHQPIVSKEGPRFFESDFWEFLTRTVWWAIPVIWLPVICWCLSMSYRMGHTVSEIALMVVSGIFVWTLLEYSLHRFLFHIKTKSYWGNTAHYLLHGCHHKHPMDGLRLVFPPAATAVLCFPFWNLVKLIATPSTTPAVFGGGLLGYVIYDVTHYYLHHGQPTSEVPKHLKKYHLNHHFRIQNKGFGITSSFWDTVFGTLPQTRAAEKASNLFKASED